MADPSPQPFIFLSHSRADLELREWFDQALAAAGFTVWVDERDIETGARWTQAIKHAVETCAAVVVILTARSAESRWVERETLYADELRKPIFVARIDDTPIPFWLSELQALDFRKENPQKAASPMMERLIRQVRALPAFKTPEKPPRSTKPRELNDHRFFKYLRRLPDGDVCAAVALDLLAWAETHTDQIHFSGHQEPAMNAILWVGNGGLTLFSVRAYSKQPSVTIPFQSIREHAPYTDPAARVRLLRRLNYLMPAGEEFDEERAERRPNLPIARALNTPDNLASLKALLEEVGASLRQADHG
ncbi:MAG: toll/interleukin-1 receptor domain-containing protein [bacterium]|nr:toll/interleukin-1 receptor domain-containing protein [bacterium]